MAHYVTINGVDYEVTGGIVTIDNVDYPLERGLTTIDGVDYPIEFGPTGTPLAEYAEGDIVYLNESGSPVEFYVAKHDYESGLNGAGRTLLVRKDCYDTRAWHSSNVNAYASSAIDTWLNGTYKGLLDADVQSVIGTTEFYYTPGANSPSVTTLTRDIFLLSVTELGKTAYYGNTEGTALSIASALQIAYRNGSAVVQWTRSPYLFTPSSAYTLDVGGGVSGEYCTSTYGSRPAFTLPADALVDDTGLVIG